jgi:hypothetical protein
MKKMIMLLTCWLGLLSGAAVFVGCSESGDASQSTTGKDGGDSGVDQVVAELCPGACAALLRCEGTVDVPACESQCAKEVTGSGYLIEHLARRVFTEIRDAEAGTECMYIQSLQPWGDWLEHKHDPDKYPLPIDNSDADVLESCVQVMFACEADESARWETHCFTNYYRYNRALRDDITKCFGSDYACMDKQLCISQKQIPQAPWIAGVPPLPF